MTGMQWLEQAVAASILKINKRNGVLPKPKKEKKARAPRIIIYRGGLCSPK